MKLNDEVLKKIANHAEDFASDILDYGHAWIDFAPEMAQELLELRQKVRDWELSVKKREEYITKLEMLQMKGNPV